MKRTQWIEFFHRIRRSIVSFIAILAFVTAGVALYTGIKWTEQSFYKSMEVDYDALKLRDMELVFSNGLSEDGVAELRELPEVSWIEGIYTVYQFLQHNGETYQAKICSVTEGVDLLRVNEGRIPEKENEIAVETYWALEHGISVGDMIVLNHDGDGSAHVLREIMDGKMPDMNFRNDDGMQYFHCDSFTVTALVDSPAELSTLTEGLECSPTSPAPVKLLLYVSPTAFDAAAFPGYTGALVRSDLLRGISTTDDTYKKAADQLTEALYPTAERLCREQEERVLDAVEQIKSSPLNAIYVSGEIPSAHVALLSRDTLGCVSMTGIVGELMSKLCTSFGLVFVVIGILVCYSTLSRLVYQETVLSGTKKALGFFNREITRSFLLYSAAVTLFGMVAGGLLSVVIVQNLILKVLSETYLFSVSVFTFRWKDFAVIFVLEIASMMFSAWLACHKTLRRAPLSLLAGSEPPSDKNRLLQRSRLYQKLPLLSKCIVQNFLNDRRRVIGTLIGIIGCTVLTVSSITFELAVIKGIDRQFGELQRFDTLVFFEPENSEAAKQIASVLSAAGTDYARVSMTCGSLGSPDGKKVSARIFADDQEFEGMISPTLPDGTPIQMEDGVQLSCAFAKQHGIESGDTVDFFSADGKEYRLPVDARIEYYIQLPRILMTADAYETYFGQAAEENVFLVERDTRTVKEIADSLEGIDGFICVSDYCEQIMRLQSIINMVITAVMVLYLALSMLIAVFVVLDILLLFVSEKKRELITLVINGYPLRYARRYICADTVFLSTIGILIGLVLGVVLGAWDIRGMESDVCYFLHGIQPFACIGGVLFTAILVAVMTVIAVRKINRFRLSDINEV